MKITVSKQAQEWFAREMGISETRGVRFLSKVYGCSPIHESFSLAIEVNEPSHPYAIVKEQGISYFIETGDEWFFEGYDFEVGYNTELDEPEYHYIKQ